MVARSDSADKFVVRLEDGQRSRIYGAAKATHRSMNSWIVDKLEEALSNTRAPIGWIPAIGQLVYARSPYDDEEHLGTIEKFLFLDDMVTVIVGLITRPTIHPDQIMFHFKRAEDILDKLRPVTL